MLCFAHCQALRTVDFCGGNPGAAVGSAGGDDPVGALTRANYHRWFAKLTMAIWRAMALRARGPGLRASRARQAPRPSGPAFPDGAVWDGGHPLVFDV